jgi:glucokinase
MPEYLPRSEATAPFFAGVDLGGTNIKVGLVDDRGRTLAWTTSPTEPGRGPDDAVRRMGEAVRRLTEEVGLKPDDVARVGLGSPGTMDIPAGMLLDPPNLPGWNDYPIRDRLAAATGRPVAFANDANAAAYGEFWVGVGAELGSLVMLTLGTGVGGGIIIGDLNLEGAHSHGSECGHIIIDYSDEARMCPCGQRGHLEAYASATAIVKQAERLLAGPTAIETTVRRRLAEGAKLTPKLLAAEAEAGDGFALELILDTARYVGIGAVSLMHTIDPAGVVIGGAMNFGGTKSELGRKFLDRIRAEVRRRAFPTLARKTVIEYASLGGDAGYIGAAGIARLEQRARGG